MQYLPKLAIVYNLAKENTSWIDSNKCATNEVSGSAIITLSILSQTSCQVLNTVCGATIRKYKQSYAFLLQPGI